VKKTAIVVVLLSLFFLLPQLAIAASINNNFTTQQQTNLRIVATSTPTQVPVRVVNPNIKIITTSTPTISRINLPAKALTNVGKLPVFARMVSPNGGEKITIGDKQSEVLFIYGGNFDMNLAGSYGYHLELWRNGQLLGNVDAFDHYPLNPNQSSVYFGWIPGQYFQKNPESGTESLKTAEAGPGYSLHVVLSLAYADPETGVTKYKDIADDMSDNQFTFLPKPANLKAFVPENYSVAVKYPDGGELLPLLKRVDIQFNYSGTFAEDQAGTYDYRLELWQNGKRLGAAHALQDYQLDIHQTQVTYGFVPDYYWTEGDNSGKAVKITTGSGYLFKVILEQAYTPAGASAAQYRELASDMSNKTFSFTAAASNPLTQGFKVITTPVRSFFSWLGGLFKGGAAKVLPQ
jgi:hypothetical protein